jgi:hypothetical protein
MIRKQARTWTRQNLGRFLPIVQAKCTKQSGQIANGEVGSGKDAMSDLVEGKQSVGCEEVRRESCGLFYGE